MQAFEAAEDMAARAREQTSRSRWTSRDYSDLGVSWALEEERAEQAAEAAEYARRVVEMAEEEEGEGEEEDEAYGDPEAEALLRESASACWTSSSGALAARGSSGCSWRRAALPGCDLRARGGGTGWWRPASSSRTATRACRAAHGMTSATGSAGSRRWVDPWGCASALRDEVDGVLGPARVEFWPWRGAHGLEPVAEEAEPHRRASAGARARVRGRGPAAVGA